MKFRAIKAIVNSVIKKRQIVARQKGSHIVFSSESSSPITLVKLHGNRKTLSSNEVMSIVEQIANVGKQ